jgi:hypothetical protein
MPPEPRKETEMIARRVSDHMWSFLIGILVGTTTGVFSGVLLVAVLARVGLQ